MKVVTQTKSHITATLQEVLDLAAKQYQTMSELPDDAPVSFDVTDVPKERADRDYNEAEAYKLLTRWFDCCPEDGPIGLRVLIADTRYLLKKTGRLR